VILNRPNATGQLNRRADSGQILIVFALSVLIIIGMVGLAMDGGATFAQRRDQQTAADLAALAGANDYLLSQNSVQAIDRARTVSAANNFTHASGSTTVGVTISTTNGVAVEVDIAANHTNSFLGALGLRTWPVSTTATALAGFPDDAAGAGPFIFSIGAFDDDGTPKYQTPTTFGEGNSAVPTSELDFAWTNYGTGNVNTTDVDNIIKGDLVIDKTIAYGEYIGQANSGSHNFLYDDVNTYDQNQDFPVAVVDANGNFMGWATFHVTSAVGGSTKQITGYFLASYTSSRLTVSACAAGGFPRYLGSYVLKLIE
jgi:Flp pilus assembly protein TadG